MVNKLKSITLSANLSCKRLSQNQFALPLALDLVQYNTATCIDQRAQTKGTVTLLEHQVHDVFTDV